MLWIATITAVVTAWSLLSLIGNERQRRLDELEIKVLLAARNSKPPR